MITDNQMTIKGVEGQMTEMMMMVEAETGDLEKMKEDMLNRAVNRVQGENHSGKKEVSIVKQRTETGSRETVGAGEMRVDQATENTGVGDKQMMETVVVEERIDLILENIETADKEKVTVDKEEEIIQWKTRRMNCLKWKEAINLYKEL